MVRLLQRVAWWIGALFCDQEIVRRQQQTAIELTEQVRLLRQYQQEDHRLLALAERHMEVCDEQHRAMRLELASLQVINEDRLAMFRLLTQESDAPPLRLVEDG